MLTGIVILFVVFLHFGFRSPLKHLFCFIIVLVIMCGSLGRFTYKNRFQAEHMFLIWRSIRINGGAFSQAGKTDLNPTLFSSVFFFMILTLY